MKYLLTILFFVFAICSFGQSVPPYLTLAALQKEIQQFKAEGSNTKSVLWFPIEYWDVSAKITP